MCGINGFTWADDSFITQMNQVTKYRGPDDQGSFINSSVSLGHNRLSIIDLSEYGHQPMCNEDKSIWITYNGEIFNFQEIRDKLIELGHIFSSKTDTEVIIHAYEEYGFDCFNYFNGMWAFCIYDQKKNILILGRDQFGIKPLYYSLVNQGIIFSSMISAILCHDGKKSPNDEAIMNYLSYNLEDHENYTFFSDIHKVPPDSLLIYNLSEKDYYLHKWYTPSYNPNITQKNIRDLFEKSIHLRTISDVPVGSCLSGGIDSSAIVCMLNMIIHNRFNTYSMINPGFCYDESRYIKEIGKSINANQYFTDINEENFLEDFVDFVKSQEEPVMGMSPFAQYQVMKLAHMHNSKVLLDGQGGDEIFAGYIYYFSYYFYELLRQGKFIICAHEMIRYFNDFRNPLPFSMLLFFFLPERIKKSIWKRYMAPWINHNFFEKICVNPIDPRWKGMDVRSSLILTLNSTAIPHLLRWEDKNAMRWSIESRPPFLDVNLVEAAMSIPTESKLKNGKTKVIFVQAISDLLPEIIRNRKDKIGFAVPVDEFFRRENIVRFSSDIIYSDSFRNRPYWNWNEVERLYKRHVRGEIDIGDTIWKWINLEVWLRVFFQHNPLNNQEIK